MWKIYKITNIINNQSYIGLTKRSLKKRFNQHCSSKSGCRLVATAIEKYGRESFKIELVEETICPLIADYKEASLIKDHNTIYPNGYNLFSGGKTAVSRNRGKRKNKSPSSFKGKTHSVESRELMRKAKKDFIPWNKGKKGVYSEETLKIMSERKKKVKI